MVGDKIRIKPHKVRLYILRKCDGRTSRQYINALKEMWSHRTFERIQVRDDDEWIVAVKLTGHTAHEKTLELNSMSFFLRGIQFETKKRFRHGT